MERRAVKPEGHTVNAQEWRVYLSALAWVCPGCDALNVGLVEREPGRIVGTCQACRWHDLLYLWGDSGWIHAPSAGVVIERN